jgi:hypothetical protein
MPERNRPKISEAPDMGTKDLILWNGKRVFVGWLDDDGWHDSENQDRNDYAENPQPTHFMFLPDPPNTED